MAQRSGRRSASFDVLPYDSPGDGEVVGNLASSDKIRVGNTHRRRRKSKTKKSNTLHPTLGSLDIGPHLDDFSDDRCLFRSSPVSDPGGVTVESHLKHFVQDSALSERWEVLSPFSEFHVEGCPLSTDSSHSGRHLSNGSIQLPSFSNLRLTHERTFDSTFEKDGESKQLLMEVQHGDNDDMEFVDNMSTTLPQDEARNSDSLSPLISESHRDSSWREASGSYGQRTSVREGDFHRYELSGGDLHSPDFSPERMVPVETCTNTCSPTFSTPELRQRTVYSVEKDSSTCQSDFAHEASISTQDDVKTNDTLECSTSKNDKGEYHGEENQTPEVLAHIPMAHTGTPQLLDWERLMAANFDYSQPANVSPIRYFLGEVMRPGASRNMPSAENDKKRQHVYNTMFHVPWRCELLIDVGFFVCLDSFLSLLTVMPTRIIMFLQRCIANGRQFQRPHADELSDFGCLLVLISGVTLLQQVDISYIYHMIRSQATIKLYVVYNLLEIFDKLCQSFGSDVLQVVLNSAEGVASCSKDLLLFESLRFAMDQCIAIVSFIVHSLIILAQSITISAAIRSHNNALLTLLISNNFAEIKSNVFKRLAKDNLHKMAYLDTVERFHIVAHLFFVLAQNLLAADEPWLLAFACNAGMVLLCEILVDVIKHAFLAKFNEIKPTTYSEFLQALCKQTLKTQSREVHKTLNFVPLGPACVVIRVLIPLYAAHLPQAPLWRRCFCIVLCGLVTYFMLVALKILVGLGLLNHANWYVERCRKKEKYFHAD